jgi:hypothetical protein
MPLPPREHRDMTYPLHRNRSQGWPPEGFSCDRSREPSISCVMSSSLVVPLMSRGQRLRFGNPIPWQDKSASRQSSSQTESLLRRFSESRPERESYTSPPSKGGIDTSIPAAHPSLAACRGRTTPLISRLQVPIGAALNSAGLAPGTDNRWHGSRRLVLRCPCLAAIWRQCRKHLSRSALTCTRKPLGRRCQPLDASRVLSVAPDLYSAASHRIADRIRVSHTTRTRPSVHVVDFTGDLDQTP